MSEFSKYKNLFIAGSIVQAVVVLVLSTMLLFGRFWISPNKNFESFPNEQFLINALILSFAAYLVFLLLLNSSHAWISKSKPELIGTLVSGAAVMIALIWLTTSNNLSSAPEVQTGVLIVLAVSVLAFLLFILTLGFQTLGLSDVAQPLALPPGSVRAFIALMLIMIFVILSVYAVRLVGQGVSNYIGTVSKEDFEQMRSSSQTYIVRVRSDGFYDVWLTRDIAPDGITLAQQLVTTVATLVVAVSGFYFGSQTVEKASEAVAASLGIHKAGAPLIGNIDPSSGETSHTVLVTLKGRNLFATKSVKLVKDQETIEAENVLANDTTIQCSLKLDKPSGTTWNVVVENAQGQKDELKDAFTITEKEAPPSSQPITPPAQPPEIPTLPTVEADSDQPGSHVNP